MSAWDRELEAGYSIDLFSGSAFGEEDVIEMWTAEGALPADAARERATEVTMIAAAEGERLPAGVCTTYVAHYERLRVDLWSYRTFVAAGHRESDLARHLLYRTIDHLSERFTSGEDTRAPGMLMVVQSPLLKRHQNRAIWRQTRFHYIGDSPRGDHVRVHWFPGATVPGPEAPRSYA